MAFGAYSVIYLALIATIAFLVSHVLDSLFGAPVVKHRETALDGLRGFLVIGVVVHHAAFWISRKDGGTWESPQGALSALGPVCVTLFFMTTAFLYYGKLLRDRGRDVDWLHITISRVLRLIPLCIVMAAAAVCVALSTTDFEIVDSMSMLTKSFFRWASVGLGGSPDINGLKNSWEMNAGVVWTLKYEILFYVSLPLFGVIALVKSRLITIIVSVILLTLMFKVFPDPEWRLMIGFLGGVVAAYAAQNTKVEKLCQGHFAALVAIVCLGSVIFSNRNTNGALSLVLLTVAFVIIACNNNIFGILSMRGVRSFGDVGYSAYLLHGLLLYLTFHPGKTAKFGGTITPLNYWLIVAVLTVFLVIICRLTFNYVELPGMRAAPRLHAWLLKIIQRRRATLTRR